MEDQGHGMLGGGQEGSGGPDGTDGRRLGNLGALGPGRHPGREASASRWRGRPRGTNLAKHLETSPFPLLESV